MGQDRIGFLAMLPLLAGLAGPAAGAPPAAGVPPSNRFVATPYLQSVTTDGVTVCFETAQPCESRVRFGAGDAMEFEVAAPRPATRHQARLSGLPAGAICAYRVEVPGLPPQAGSFRTAPDGPAAVRIVAWGDNQDSPGRFGPLVRRMLALAPDLAVGLGDLVGWGDIPSHWPRDFLGPAAELLRRVPFFSAHGNHDGEKGFAEVLSQPGNERYFAVTYAGIRLIFLDPRFDEGDPGIRPWGRQHRWIRNELDSDAFRRARFRLVFLHHPPYSEGFWPWYGGEKEVREHLVPLFEAAGVDVVFSGHHHGYERGQWPRDRGVHYVVSGGGGAFQDPFHWRDLPQIEFSRAGRHFLLIEGGPDRLRVTAIDEAGNAFDTFTREAHPDAP